MNVLDFLRDIGKNFRVGTMISKDIVARRLNSEEGISFTEFSLPGVAGQTTICTCTIITTACSSSAVPTSGAT
jgi:hypothetical protein